MTTNLTKYLAIPLIAFGIGGKIKAQINGNLEYNLSKDPLIETNFFYKLPLKTNGFTLLDYSFKNKGFFNKTCLETPLYKNLNFKSRTYGINEPLTKSGWGINYKIPLKSKDVVVKLGILPLWLDKKGKIIENNVQGEYFINIKFPKDFSLVTLGEINFSARGVPKWNYGEIEVNKKFGKNKKWEVSYNPSLTSQNKFIPKYNNRIALRKTF